MSLSNEFSFWMKTPLSEIADTFYEEIGRGYLDEGNPRNMNPGTSPPATLDRKTVKETFIPQIAEEIRSKVKTAMNEKRRDFARDKTLLYGYLVDEDNGFVSNEEDESKLLLNQDGKKILQPHLQGESPKSQKLLERSFDYIKEFIKPLLKTTLRARNIGKETFDSQLKSAVKKIIGVTGALSTADMGTSYADDLAALNSVLNKFYDLATSKRLSEKDKKAIIDGTMSATDLVYRPANKNMARKHLQILEDQDMIELNPLIQQVKEAIEEDEKEISQITRVNISGEYLIGDLNLADLASRREIYNYWEDVNKQGYDRVKKEYRELYKAFQKNQAELIGEGENLNEELNTLIEDFKDFDAHFEGAYDTSMNYVLPFKATPFSAVGKDTISKVETLFDRFLRDMNLVDTGSGAELDMETMRENLLEQGLIEEDRTQTTITQRGKGEEEDTSGSARLETGSDAQAPLTDLGEAYRQKTTQSKERARRMPTVSHTTSEGVEGPRTEGGIKPTAVKEEFMDNLTNLISEFKEIVEDQQKFESMLDKDVDPLFAYAFMKDSDAFRNTAVLKDELDELRIGIESNIFALDLDYDDRISDWLDDLERTATELDTRNLYYLPLSSTVEEMIFGSKDKPTFRIGGNIASTVTPRDIELKKETITQFLNNLVSFVEKGHEYERSGPSSRARTKDSQAAITRDELMSLDVVFPARSNDESHLEAISLVKKEFNQLLDAVIDYYIVPIGGIYMPFDDDVPYLTKSTSRGIFAHLTKGIVEDGYFAIMAKEREDATFVDREDIIDIANDLKEISSPNFSENAKDFSRKLQTLQKSVVSRIYGESPKSTIGQQMKEELGAYFYHMAKRNNIPDYENIKMWGEPVSDLWKEHKANPRRAASPFAAFIKHVRRHSGGSGKGAKSGHAGDKGLYLREKSRGSDDSQFRNALQVFNDVRELFNITKSEEELQILSAHDSIRKMLGKEVYYGTSNVEDFNHIGKAIDTMHNKFNVDVSAVEVENIINDFDSMDVLAKKYGVPSDSVYYLKANFR